MWGTGQSPDGSAGTKNLIQNKALRPKSKGHKRLILFLCFRDRYSQRRPTPSVARTPRNSRVQSTRANSVRLRTRRGSGATGKPPRKGGCRTFGLYEVESVNCRTVYGLIQRCGAPTQQVARRRLSDRRERDANCAVRAEDPDGITSDAFASSLFLCLRAPDCLDGAANNSPRSFAEIQKALCPLIYGRSALFCIELQVPAEPCGALPRTQVAYDKEAITSNNINRQYSGSYSIRLSSQTKAILHI